MKIFKAFLISTLMEQNVSLADLKNNIKIVQGIEGGEIIGIGSQSIVQNPWLITLNTEEKDVIGVLAIASEGGSYKMLAFKRNLDAENFVRFFNKIMSIDFILGS